MSGERDLGRTRLLFGCRLFKDLVETKDFKNESIKD